MDGAVEMSNGRFVRKAFFTFVFLTLLVACLTALWYGMRAVMDVGGSCGSSNTYQVVTPCPGGAWLVPVSVWVGIAATALYIGNQSGLPGPQWWPLTWPALFLSLGYNFWDYGLNPPGENTPDIVWGWIVCGVLFVLMGGLPLLAFVWTPAGRRSLLWDDAEEVPAGKVATIDTASRSVIEKAKVPTRSKKRRPTPPADDPLTPATYTGAVRAPVMAGAVAGGPDRAGDDDRDDLAEDLERVAALYRNGELTVDEFQDAKRRLIEGDAG